MAHIRTGIVILDDEVLNTFMTKPLICEVKLRKQIEAQFLAWTIGCFPICSMTSSPWQAKTLKQVNSSVDPLSCTPYSSLIHPAYSVHNRTTKSTSPIYFVLIVCLSASLTWQQKGFKSTARHMSVPTLWWMYISQCCLLRRKVSPSYLLDLEENILWWVGQLSFLKEVLP